MNKKISAKVILGVICYRYQYTEYVMQIYV